MLQAIECYQEQGEAVSLKAANDGINNAKNFTPYGLREQFRSYIRRQSGKYVWGWVLK